jgi:hypothetical protein
MAAKSEGRVLERSWKSGRGYALRFPAYGERRYLTLGLPRRANRGELAPPADRQAAAQQAAADGPERVGAAT